MFVFIRHKIQLTQAHTIGLANLQWNRDTLSADSKQFAMTKLVRFLAHPVAVSLSWVIPAGQ